MVFNNIRYNWLLYHLSQPLPRDLRKAWNIGVFEKTNIHNLDPKNSFISNDINFFVKITKIEHIIDR